jgi:tRNA(Ile)-lysidine synthase
VVRSGAIDTVVAPDPRLTARFAEGLARVWPGDGRLGLAVSGGSDSLALLLLARAALPDRVEAATVDHGLRPESVGEAAEVAAVCHGLGVPHATLRVRLSRGNVQSQAREARYAALAGWLEANELGALATAHHADDQAETLAMRLNRGSGVAGLAGVREQGRVPGTRVPLIRPLLDWRRNELGAVVAAAGLRPAEDPSNADDRFDRARIRPRMAAAEWIDVPAWSRSAAHLADADLALEWAAAREWGEQVERSGLGVVYRPRAPRAIALRVIARIVGELDGEEPRGSAVARLFDDLVTGRAASIGSLVARPSFDGWSFTPAPKRRA